MSDDQLRAMARQMGMPDAPLDALRGGLDADLMTKVAKVQVSVCMLGAWGPGSAVRAMGAMRMPFRISQGKIMS